MKRMFVTTMLLTLACVAALHGAAQAQRPGPDGRGEYGPPGGMMGGPMGGPGHHGRPPGGPGFRPPSLEDLERAGVTASQRAKIQDLHEQSMRSMIRSEADLRIAELDLHQLLESDKANAAAVEAAIDRIGDMRTALFKAHVSEMLAVRALLTPEQRAKLREGATSRKRR